MEFIANPFHLQVILFFKFFDNTFADKAKGSNVIRKDCQVNAHYFTSDRNVKILFRPLKFYHDLLPGVVLSAEEFPGLKILFATIGQI
ncbi:hypothetical protein DCCM_3001 [Desulfocucumis palustris]|uniref:Uncharacterized protein n=1 Tax=Desulfocucumis palustris TaxID=1898651 RepID=A0A2L2XCM1_9FIRM|nr:hypothetical protein [Desulfocucumis palustris]GBF33890.1 hypothetical protein DCCM_3001 [Desulfocucumis palustris]